MYYKSVCRSEQDDCVIEKYADDTVLTGVITNDQDLYYKEELINSFVDWCDRNRLVLTIIKTKEIIVDIVDKRIILKL